MGSAQQGCRAREGIRSVRRRGPAGQPAVFCGDSCCYEALDEGTDSESRGVSTPLVARRGPFECYIGHRLTCFSRRVRCAHAQRSVDVSRVVHLFGRVQTRLTARRNWETVGEMGTESSTHRLGTRTDTATGQSATNVRCHPVWSGAFWNLITLVSKQTTVPEFQLAFASPMRRAPGR